jgi:two-component system, cell cycle sensor histidine kinase and response regulator CckA
MLDQQIQVTSAYDELQRINSRLEGSLRDQQNRIAQLEAITMSVPGVIFQYAVSADGTHGFEYVSANVLPVFGLAPDDLLVDASVAWRCISADDRGTVKEQVMHAMRTRVPWVQEFRISAPDRPSAVRWIAVHCIPREDRSAQRIVWTGIVSDVDAQRDVQDRLWKSQRLESIGVLAGGIAHDFNNVLTAIVAEVELLELDFAGDARIGDSVAHIRTAAASGATLSRHLLGFAGRAVNAPQVTPVDAAISRVAPLLRRLLREHVRLEVDVPSGLGNVRIDSGLFDQVLMNLATNARDAMNGRGMLRITAARYGEDRPQYFASLPPGDLIEVTVSDSGEGMPEEVRRHAFEPFYTTKSVGRGSGLGLATSHGIITQANGAMWIDPPGNDGCTIRIGLPVSTLTTSTVERGVGAGPLGAETLLVVDDDHQVRRVTIETLRRRGYRVLEAANAADALRLARRHPDTVDLLITDVVMPDMDGVELARTMEAERLTRGVLFVSGYALDSIAHHGVDAADMDLVAKPYRVETLAQRVRARLDAQVTPSGRHEP